MSRSSANSLFLLEVVGISLSGVLAPGPLTATSVALGVNSPMAGSLVAIGHGIVEWPIMILLITGLVRFLDSEGARTGLALIGGLVLGWMGLTVLRAMSTTNPVPIYNRTYGPILAGVVLTAANPYFLIWWGTIGLKLSSDAWERGMLIFGLFALVHWLCDAVWLGILSWVSYKGSSLSGSPIQRLILIISGAAMILFAIRFVLDGISRLRGLHASRRRITT